MMRQYKAVILVLYTTLRTGWDKLCCDLLCWEIQSLKHLNVIYHIPRNIQKADRVLAPILESLAPIANITVESQVVFLSSFLTVYTWKYFSLVTCFIFSCHIWEISFFSDSTLLICRFYTMLLSHQFLIGMTVCVATP